MQKSNQNRSYFCLSEDGLGHHLFKKAAKRNRGTTVDLFTGSHQCALSSLKVSACSKFWSAFNQYGATLTGLVCVTNTHKKRHGN